MYEQYWGLTELPFENTPDPKFFFRSEKHAEALARLQYLIEEKKPCGVLSGVYGCGKTLVVQSLMQKMEPEGYRFSLVSNPRLDDLGIIRMILYNFTKHEVPASKSDVLIALEQLVNTTAHEGKHSVVIIDEAHAIEDLRIFEELRLLVNIQTANRFLLTLLIVGQPELKPKIEANKQLNQRVSLRFHLDAFQFEDTQHYIYHRLKIAGGNKDDIFNPEALDLVHKASGGIPRWINHYCHLSLLLGFSKGASQITPEIVTEAVQSLAGAI